MKSFFKNKLSFFLRFLFVLLFFYSRLDAQQLRFNRYTVEDGLQNNIVLAAAQDAKGFLWFATTTGIDRYDGNKFQSYKMPLRTGGYSEYIQIPFLFTDEQKKVWAASLNEIYSYNQLTDAFERFTNQDLPGSNSRRTITAFSAGKNNTLLIGYNNGLSLYNQATKRFLHANKFSMFVRSVFQDNRGIIWVGTTAGISRFIFHDNQLNILSDTNFFQQQLSKLTITHISQDQLGRYWIVTLQKGLFIYDERNSSLQHHRLNGLSSKLYVIKDVYHDKATDQTYVLQDGGGVIVLDRKLHIKHVYLTNEDDLSSLSNNAAYDILCDSYDRIWITTYGGGINEAIIVSQPFYNIQHQMNDVNSLRNNAAKAICEDKQGILWFGTRKGLSAWKPVTNKWKHFNEDNLREISSENILSLTVDTNGFIWAGTYGGGLLLIDPLSNKIKTYRNDASDSTSVGTDFIYAVENDVKGRIWLGGIRGPLSVLDPALNKVKRINLGVTNIYCLLETKQQEMLVGTEKGVLRINGEFGISQLHPKLSNKRILYIQEAGNGDIWIGTMGDGLFVVNRKGNIISELKLADGLPADIVCGIIEDKNGDFWISTSKGIAHYQTKTKYITAYSKADGLAGSQFNYGAAYGTKGGKIIFGSTDGFSLFDPQDIRSKGFTPAIAFTGLTINNKPVISGSEEFLFKEQIDEVQKLTLKYFQNSFAISFANTSPAFSGKHLYSWKLEGFDKEWSQPVTIPNAVYTNLNSGSYTLLVKSFAKGHSDISELRKLPILIKAPWWRTKIAYISYLLLLTALGIAIYNYYNIRNTRKKYAERLKLNASISHEIRTPLTLIKGPVHALSIANNLSEAERSNLELAKRNIEKLEGIISQFIDYQKTGLNKMQMQVVRGDVTILLNEIAASFKPLMEQKYLKFTYNRPSTIVELLFDKDKMEKVLNNLLSNAVKYTPENGQITLSVLTTAKELLIKVKDTGIGIPEDQQQHIFKGYFRADNTVNLKEVGSGIGLNVAKELIDMQKGKLEFNSEKNQGTEFTIRLPLQNDALLPYLVKERLLKKQVDFPEFSTTENGRSTKNKILIVEDNDELRQYLKTELINTGYKVFDEPNGQLAWDFLQKNQVDLVITDVMMPEMNGFQFCNAIKKQINTLHLPVIMLTAIHDKDYLMEGYRCGADDFVRKPFDLAYIITRIENLVQNRTRFRNKIMRVFEQEETLVKEDEDISWLKNVTALIAENLNNPDFSVEKLSSMMAMSRPVLFRRFKSITNDSPQQYIIQIRLRKAVELLQQQAMNINEVAFECGFSDPKYFSTAFKKQFGKSPRDYVQGLAL